jgi:thioredoxin 1
MLRSIKVSVFGCKLTFLISFGEDMMTSVNVLTATESDFDEKVLRNQKPVFVDFSAEWCGPCKTIEPFIDELAAEYNGAVSFVKIDTDKNPGLATAYGVRSMPTFIMFKNGEQAGFLVGVNPNKIRDMINKV